MRRPTSNSINTLKKMKKIFALGWMLVAALALTNCSKDEEATTVAQKHNFELIADMGTTRTVIDGYTSSWVAGDQMNVFFGTQGAWVGTTDQIFTITEENLAAGKFTGTLDASYDDTKTYDWYAIYPYSKYVYTSTNYEGGTSTPEQISYISVGYQTQTQTGNNSTAHLCKGSAPLYGKAVGVVGTDIPSMTMQHLASFIKVSVTNNLGKAVTVNSVKLVSEMATISGSNYICLTEDKPVYTPHDTKSYSDVTLTVKEGEAIEVGESADFYMSITPFNTEDEVETLTVEITTTAGHTTTKSFTIPIGKTFSAGKVNTLKVTANADNTVVNTYEIPFEDDFSWLSTAELTNTTSGQFDMSQKAEYASSAYTYYDEVNGIKLGTGDYRGSFTTNPFNLSQNFTVVVTAMTYNTDASTIDVTVGDVTKSYTLYANKYITYAFPFDAVAEPAQVTVTINGKRGYIKDFAIQTSSYEAQPAIIITSGDIIAEAKGITDGVITYDIINALDDTSVVATTDAEDWIHFGVPADGQLTYSIDEGTETRNATITLSYGTANDAIAVTQTKPSNATDVTFNFPQLSLTNAAEILDPITQGPITLQFAAGSYSSSAKYYTSGSAIRFYAGNTVTISGGNIIKILVSYSSASYAKTTACDSGEFTVSGAQGTWMGSAESVTLTNSSTAQQRITQITVYYE